MTSVGSSVGSSVGAAECRGAGSNFRRARTLPRDAPVPTSFPEGGGAALVVQQGRACGRRFVFGFFICPVSCKQVVPDIPNRIVHPEEQDQDLAVETDNQWPNEDDE